MIDPLTTEATARARLQLANDTLGERPVTAVIYTHSHVDHFGGVLGVTSADAVANGEVRIIALSTFSVRRCSRTSSPVRRWHVGRPTSSGRRCRPGPANTSTWPRQGRAAFQPGPLADRGDHRNWAGAVVDGVRIVFQNTPESEAPAEMNFTSTRVAVHGRELFAQHAQPGAAAGCSRSGDSLAWSKYINEAIELFGGEPRSCSPAITGPGGATTTPMGSSASSATCTAGSTIRPCDGPIEA
ncbi:MAG: MBL fold metallo-hydrolase [Acidimicrobiales bacterium]